MELNYDYYFSLYSHVSLGRGPILPTFTLHKRNPHFDQNRNSRHIWIFILIKISIKDCIDPSK